MGLGCSAFDRSSGLSTCQLQDDGRCYGADHSCTTTKSPCDSGVAMTTSQQSVRSPSDRPVSGKKSAIGEVEREKNDEDQRRVVTIEELKREDGDGAVDDDQPPAERIENVDSDRTTDVRHRLTPYSTPPTSPPPTQSASAPSGSTVELRVETKRCGSSSSSWRGGGGSRLTSSERRRSPSVVEEPATVAELIPVSNAVVDQELGDTSTGSSGTAKETEDSVPQVDASDEAPVDRISTKAQDNQEEQTTTSDVATDVDAAAADSTTEPQEQVQPEVDSGKMITAETNNDNKPEKVSDQQETPVPEEQPETEGTPPDVDCQVEQEAVNSADQLAKAESTEVAGERIEETVGELPVETSEEQPNAGSPATESEANAKRRRNRDEVVHLRRDQDRDQEDEQRRRGSRLLHTTGSRRGPRQRLRENDSSTTESEELDVDVDDSDELGNSLESSSMAAIRRLRDRIPTPGPRRTVSANEHGVTGSLMSQQVVQLSLERHAEKGESDAGPLQTSKPQNPHKLRPQMKRFLLHSFSVEISLIYGTYQKLILM